MLKTKLVTVLRARLDLNYHSSKQNQINVCTNEWISEDHYVSQEAEKYNVKVAESNVSAESFDLLRYMICTNRKTAIFDLPPWSAAIQSHLLQALYFKYISLKILDTIKSMLQPLNFISQWNPKQIYKKVCMCM